MAARKSGPVTKDRGALIRKDCPWMTTEERRNFLRLRKAGAISFFRVTLCKRAPLCTEEVPRVVDPTGVTAEKPFCSQKCHDAMNLPKEDGDEDEDGQA